MKTIHKMNKLEERAYAFVFRKLDPAMPCYADLVEDMLEEYKEIATEQRKIDIDTIPQLYVRWLMIDGEKPSWKEYATKAMKG